MKNSKETWDYKSQLIADFNARKNYDSNKSYHAEIAKRLVRLSNIKPGHSVLDVATGTGLVAIPAAEEVGSNGSVIGIDISTGMLQQAKTKAAERRMENVEFIEIDAESLGVFNQSSFDRILCSSSIFYFRNLHSTFSQWKRLLCENGILGFTCFSENSFPLSILFREILLKQGIIIADPHLNLGTPEKCIDYLSNIGFKDIQISMQEYGSHTNDVEKYWYRNLKNAFSYQVHQYPEEKLQICKAEYLKSASTFLTGKGIWNNFTVIYVIANK